MSACRRGTHRPFDRTQPRGTWLFSGRAGSLESGLGCKWSQWRSTDWRLCVRHGYVWPLSGTARTLNASGRWASRRWISSRTALRQHQIDCDLTFGYLHAANKPRDVTALRQWRDEAQQRFGYDRFQYVERARMGDYVESSRYLGGLYDPDSGHLHPAQLHAGPRACRARSRRADFRRQLRHADTQRNQRTCDSKPRSGQVHAQVRRARLQHLAGRARARRVEARSCRWAPM